MKKSFLSIVTLLLLAVSGAVAQNEWNTIYKEIDARIKAPEFRTKTYVAGVKASNSAKNNQLAINKAISKCSKAGGGKVVIRAGRYMTGPITLKSNVNLCIEKDAELVFAFDRSLYPLVYTRWEGLDLWNYQPCVYAIDC